MELDDIYAKHGNQSYYDFWVLGNDEGFSKDEFRLIVASAEKWSRENEIPCQLIQISDGFEVELVHLCHSGAGIISGLFLKLARGVFRDIEKGVAYGPKRNDFVARHRQDAKTSNCRKLEDVQTAFRSSGDSA